MDDFIAITDHFPSAVECGPSTVFTPGTSDSHNDPSFIVQSGFLEMFYRGEFRYVAEARFSYHREQAYTQRDFDFYMPPCTLVRAHFQGVTSSYLLQGPHWWAAIMDSGSYLVAWFGGASASEVQDIAKDFRRTFEVKSPARPITNFEIWSNEDFPTTRFFDDTRWDDIYQNYPATTRRGLSELSLITREHTKNNGRIILFHGPPGTGKTWAIRSLLTTWKDWTCPALIIDPERLLESPTYFMNMLTFAQEGQTRLVVIEDADEIAEKDGTRGSNVSRLLNATDGIVGASSNILILLSTNAPPSALDAALVRPGRCLATIEFGAFSATEASTRLGRTVDKAMSLAEIYAALGKTSKVSAGAEPAATGQYL